MQAYSLSLGTLGESAVMYIMKIPFHACECTLDALPHTWSLGDHHVCEGSDYICCIAQEQNLKAPSLRTLGWWDNLSR